MGLPEVCSGHDISSLIKKFFRLLKEPILTWDLQAQFLQFARIKNESTRLKSILELFYVLPSVNRDTLAFTLRQIKKVRCL